MLVVSEYAPGDEELEKLETEAREAQEDCGLIRSPCRRRSGDAAVGSDFMAGLLSLFCQQRCLVRSLLLGLGWFWGWGWCSGRGCRLSLAFIGFA